MYDIRSIYQANSVSEAIAALVQAPQSILIAGGTDLLIKIRQGQLAGCDLVSIHNLAALKGIQMTQAGTLAIGSLATFRDITQSPLICATVPVLGEAAHMAGGPQLQAAGTIGGNLANGITSADLAPALMALEAILRIEGPQGQRELPISQWYKGVGKVALTHEELLVKILIPQSHYLGWTAHYIKYAQRNAMDIATLGVCCAVKLSPDKKELQDIHLAFGVAGPVPLRATKAEAALKGLAIQEALAKIPTAALADVNPRSSWRASKEFRLHLVGELSCGALKEALRKGGATL